VNVWAVGEETVAIWTSPDEYPGFCVAGKLKITTGDLTVKWNSCDYIYELGGALG
jgi:hypothetical protein